MKRTLLRSTYGLALAISLLGTSIVNAQFTITEPFKNGAANSSIIFGGAPYPYLTSGKEDQQGDGWLRMTKAEVNQKGYAFIDQSFPSTLGIFVDFEFKAWRDKEDGYNGADGFSVFLFDGNVDKDHFVLGGYGGSLGYAPNTYSNPAINNGLYGGYLGIGLDEFGNFVHNNEGRNGGLNDITPNSIGLRGPTTNELTTSNRYIASAQLNSDPTSNLGIDYNKNNDGQFPQSRPDDNTYYRRVQISIIPNNNKYEVIVKMATTPGGAFTQYIDQTIDDAPPPTLKLGFAASTGSGFNYHEIRNLMVTTPGGVRLDNSSDVSSATIGTPLTFTLNAYNSTTSNISNLLLNGTFYDGDGNIIPADQLRIDGIDFTDNGNTSNVLNSKSFDNGQINASLNMGASTTAAGDARGTFTVHATVLQKPAGGVINFRAALDPSGTGITDQDPTNDQAAATVNVIANDLALSVTHDDLYAGDQNKNFVIAIANNGPDATANTTTVQQTLPAGLTYAGTTGDQGNGWFISVENNVVTAINNGSVASGASFPSLTIPVNVDASASNQTVTNTVSVQNAADPVLTNNELTEDILIQDPSALPVTLSSFTGIAISGANQLSWTTASEINNKGFELQRSADAGSSWQTLIFKNGFGTSSSTHHYFYEDAEGSKYAKSSYRLVQMDQNGNKVIENKIITISRIPASSIVIAPNPAKNYVNILGVYQGDFIRIYTSSGTLVKKVTATDSKVSLPTSGLARGLYFIKITGKQQTNTQKLLIQ